MGSTSKKTYHTFSLFYGHNQASSSCVTDGRTENRLCAILRFASALNEPLRNNNWEF